MKIKKNDEFDQNIHATVPRVAALSTTAFYALIVLEFFYMASPFAAYIYSAYGPGLDWLSRSELTAWTTRFVLPHIVSQTTSAFVNSHTIAGLVLLLLGLIGFAIGAFRIYRNKFGHGAIIQSGLYRYIRHPQYLSLIVASLGMLLIWPRMLAVAGFALVVLLYIALAKSEEQRCLSLDPGYDDYRSKTGFFLPRVIEGPFRLTQRCAEHLPRFIYWPLITLILLSALIAASNALRNWSTTKVQGVYSTSMATISIGNEPLSIINSVLSIALSENATTDRLGKLNSGDRRFINYVLPTDMYVSEIPMHIPAGATTTHHYHNDTSRQKFKIIFTEGVFPAGEKPTGIDIMRMAVNKTPVAEVWVDLKNQVVENHLPPTTNQFYNALPVPVY